MSLLTRLSYAFALLTGRFTIPTTVKDMELNMAFETLKAAVASGDAAANRLIAKSSSDAAALADAEAQVANIEAEGLAIVQPLVDKLTDAAPEAAA